MQMLTANSQAVTLLQTDRNVTVTDAQEEQLSTTQFCLGV
jgi:hypothetical protein